MGIKLNWKNSDPINISVRDRVESSRAHGLGWYYGPNMTNEHFCFPPKIYPAEVGPGSLWMCPGCRAVWVARGYQLADGIDYPIAVDRRDVALGVEIWEFSRYDLSNSETPYPKKSAEAIEKESAMYDFRPVAPYYVRLWRAQLEALGVDWRPLS